MSLKYEALLQPLRIRNVILRNRMLSTASTPHFLQGTEAAPGEKVISHFANRARNGAAAVTINHFHQDNLPAMGRAIDNPPGHFNLFELNDPSAQNYICQLVDAIHLYGAKATGYLMQDPGWMYEDGKVPPLPDGSLPPFLTPGTGAVIPQCTENDHPRSTADDFPPSAPLSSYTKEQFGYYCQNAAREASDLKRLGFDIISVHCCYRHSPHAMLASPITNDRTDEYGAQTVASRNRLILELFQAIRAAVGPDTPLEVVYSVDEESAGGYTVEDTIEFCKLADGLIDIIHLRAGDMDPQHPLGFTSTEEMPTPYLDKMAKVTQAVHELGLSMVVAVSSGFQNPDWANQAVAQGKADLIGMARSWINNENYGKLVYEGRGEDIVPCIRCNKCHVSNGRDMWRSVCSVNPRLGLEDKLERLFDAKPEKSLRCAVIGGGPAGMEFARVATERGHQVTLYEASDRLGGQLNHADYPSFKWPLKQFKNFMVAQMDRLGVDVRLNTRATRELLAKENYDVIVAAIGSTPTCPKLPGIDGENVHYASKIYGSMENQLAEDIVMIGGGEIGVETALYLCEKGKRVTVLEQLPELISDAPHAHYRDMVHNYWINQPNFRFQCGVTVTSIDPDGVNYTDYQGNPHKITCGDVLLSVGARPLAEEAMEFAGISDKFFVIGDCDTAANVQRAMRSAFGIASSI
jgi:2,4-dienoyl-CoA reductase-like NADH-dependent reductase (Old Yellow Enzyme family)/thioredoxin reductase